MGAIETHKVYGVMLRESANDGSDFTNPPSDYRIAFLGEDGQLHVRDSAGTVTDIGSGSGSLSTDTLWDAAGDMVIGTGANTAAKVSIGSSGKVWQSNGTTASWQTPTSGTSYGQTNSYPTVFTGDVIDGSSTVPFVDTSAFDTKEVLNSRILHLKTLGASKDQRVRVTLGTTKAASFDVTTAVAFNGTIWSAKFDSYLEVRLSTSADAQIAIARLGLAQFALTGADQQQQVTCRLGGSSIAAADANTEFPTTPGTTYTLRFARDGSNVITFGIGLGTAPMALVTPVAVSDDSQTSATVSGTLARVEYSIHTPSGPGSTARWDGYVDYLASV